jgi:hypothetical protein
MNTRGTTVRTGLALLTAAGMVAVLPGTAGADPIKPKTSSVFPIECEHLGSLTVATNGNGDFTPGHVTTSTQVGIPYELHLSGSFTPSDGGPTETFTEEHVKRGPRNGRLDVCTFHVEASDEFGSFEFGGTVKISYSPLKG